ncbi:MAG: MFS transporter [Acidimicrobiaceae bacterium]|nr:MFS transporter [Acidimicrobiia bacterium]MCY4494385.1 MFS transporter [Acidimicrobiaceae bacterium]
MTTISTTSVCDRAELQQRRQPRSDIVAEALSGTDRWSCLEGPFRQYERTLEAQPASDGRYQVTETTTYKLAVSIWAWLFHFPVRRALMHRRQRYGYWWAPPDRLDQRAATVLALLAGIQIVDGYLGSVLSQTITFAADEFGHGNQAQGWVLSVARVGVLIALVTAALADRRGRRSLLLGAGIASCVLTVLGGLSPNLWVLGGSQLAARGLSTALGILIAIVAVEEMPYRSRAWAASVLTLSAGLGSGMAVWILPVADLSERGWRAIYLVAIVGVAVVALLGRRLPESRRFMKAAPIAAPTDSLRARRRGRFTLLATSAFLLAMFWAPASGFRNDFLKDEQGFSGAGITVFTITTATPIGIGLLLGGYLAERHGRRRVGALGIVLGTALTSASYFFDGVALWSTTLLGGVLGALAVPALAVYGPELFGTHNRGRTNGAIITLGVAGSALGLFFVGYLSDRMSAVGPAIAVLSAGPLIVTWLILTRFPETAGLELEEINPEDA